VTRGLPLACQTDPERWFDRQHRTHALRHCLACPRRRRCAADALDARASLGMWAGIWIDGNLAEVAHYLHAIARSPARDPDTVTHVPTAMPAPPPPATPPNGASLPATAMVSPADVGVQRLSPWVAVEIRSSAHCEIMAAGCRYRLDEIGCRVGGLDWRSARDASALYAVCHCCAATVSTLDQRRAKRLGYLVDTGSQPQSVPFFWRHARWLLFDAAGGLWETPAAA
jgi:hypothetical protein